MPTTAGQLIPYNVLTATPDVCRDDKAIADRLEAILNAYEGPSTAYTPTWTADTTNPTIGNGTINGSYKRLGAGGKLIYVQFQILFGSTTAYGNGVYAVALPVAPAAGKYAILPVFFNTAGGYAEGLISVATQTPAMQGPSAAGSSIIVPVGHTGVAGGAWASGGWIIGSGMYEAA